MAEEKLNRRREYSRHLRGGGRNQTANILEAIAQLSGGGGQQPPTRMKILVKKEDLKQVMDAIRDGCGVVRRPPPSGGAGSLEQRLNWMRRRQIMRQMKAAGKSRLGSWRPVLQSIPEEQL
ncbi:hypothetical protein ABFS82_14G123100 [Erythranthe guttata]